MENFLNTLNEKILIIDYTGKILFLNKSLLIQLGYKPNEIINKNILSLTFTKEMCIRDRFTCFMTFIILIYPLCENTCTGKIIF